MIFANATLTVSRKAGTTTSTIATGVSARIRRIGNPNTGGDQPAAGFRYRVYVDIGTDVRVKDELSGYNPRGITPTPIYVVEDAAQEDGPLGYIVVTAIDRRSRES